MLRTCVNNANSFCYICGEVILASQKCSRTAVVKKAYHQSFGCKIWDQDKSWAPHYCCIRRATYLHHWLSKKKKSMPFAVRIMWREPNNWYQLKDKFIVISWLVWHHCHCYITLCRKL